MTVSSGKTTADISGTLNKGFVRAINAFHTALQVGRPRLLTSRTALLYVCNLTESCIWIAVL